jgi:hypothetical protein
LQTPDGRGVYVVGPRYIRLCLASRESCNRFLPLLFLFGASGSGALLMDAFFSATLSRPPLEGALAWVAPALGELVCHGGNMRSIFRRRHTVRGHALYLKQRNPAR